MSSSQRWIGYMTLCLWSLSGLSVELLAAAVNEHGARPRLLLDRDGMDRLREVAQTSQGQGLLTRMEMLSEFELSDRERLKEAGYQAAGVAAVYALTGEARRAAQTLEMLRRRLLGFPMEQSLSLMEQSCRLAGSALAYDLSATAWEVEDRREVGRALQARALSLAGTLQAHIKENPPGPLEAVAASACGLMLLAVRDEPFASVDLERELKAMAELTERYVRTSISAQGVDVHGEGPKQVVLASGILPFSLAWEQAYGVFPVDRSKIEAAFMATAMQTLGDAGTLRYGSAGSAVDRAGYFAMGLAVLQDEDLRFWQDVYRQAAPPGQYDVTRPVHGLFVFPWLQEMDSEQTRAGTLDRPLTMSDTESGLYVWRDGWDDQNGVLFSLHMYRNSQESHAGLAGDFRLFGLGGRWATYWGPHATRWGPVGGRIRNTAGPYGPKMSFQKQAAEVMASEMVAPGRYVVALRRSAELTPGGTRRKRKDDSAAEMPETADYEVTRSIAIDFSGTAGTRALLVFFDHIDVDAALPTSWTMHTAARFAAIEADMRELRQQEQTQMEAIHARLAAGELSYAEGQEAMAAAGRMLDDALKSLTRDRRFGTSCDLEDPEANGTLRVSAWSDSGPAEIQTELNRPYWNLLRVDGARRYVVVLSLQQGEPPPVRFETVEDERFPTVYVGRQPIRLNGSLPGFMDEESQR